MSTTRASGGTHASLAGKLFGDNGYFGKKLAATLRRRHFAIFGFRVSGGGTINDGGLNQPSCFLSLLFEFFYAPPLVGGDTAEKREIRGKPQMRQ